MMLLPGVLDMRRSGLTSSTDVRPLCILFNISVARQVRKN